MSAPSYRDNWQEQDGDGTTSCTCLHCHSLGRYEQTTECRYYSKNGQ